MNRHFVLSALMTLFHACFLSDAFFSVLFETKTAVSMGLYYESLTSYAGWGFWKEISGRIRRVCIVRSLDFFVTGHPVPFRTIRKPTLSPV